MKAVRRMALSFAQRGRTVGQESRQILGNSSIQDRPSALSWKSPRLSLPKVERRNSHRGGKATLAKEAGDTFELRACAGAQQTEMLETWFPP